MTDVALKIEVIFTGMSMTDPSDHQHKSIKNFRLGGEMVVENQIAFWKNDDGSLTQVEYEPLKKLKPGEYSCGYDDNR